MYMLVHAVINIYFQSWWNNQITKKSTTANCGTIVTVQNLHNAFPVRIWDERAKFNPLNLKLMLQKYFFGTPKLCFTIAYPSQINITRPLLPSLSQAASLEFGAQTFAALCEHKGKIACTIFSTNILIGKLHPQEDTSPLKLLL